MNDAKKEVIEKMCTYVDVKFEDVDFNDKFWFSNHTWTPEQEKDFTDWLVNEIRTNNFIRKGITTLSYRPSKKRVKKVVVWFILAWGWKTKL